MAYERLVRSYQEVAFRTAYLITGDASELGEKFTTATISCQDVTEEYVDLESRERNLRATEESLLRLYDRAENVEEALSIQRELTTVRGRSSSCRAG